MYVFRLLTKGTYDDGTYEWARWRGANGRWRAVHTTLVLVGARDVHLYAYELSIHHGLSYCGWTTNVIV